MDKDKISKERQKKFWELCGLVHIDNPITEIAVANSSEAMALDKPLNGWYLPDYEKGTSELISHKETPNIDLNSFFKYAVPKLDDVRLTMNIAPSGDVFWNARIKHYGDKGAATDEDPAIALFLAIEKVFND